MRQILLLLVLVFSFTVSAKRTDKLKLNSPDGELKLNFCLVDNSLRYSLNWKNEELIKQSELGFLQNSNLKIKKIKVVEHDSVWTPQWEQFSSIRNHYKQLELDVECNKIKAKLFARVYNQGVAFRFVIGQSKTTQKAMLACSYALPEGSSYFGPKGEGVPFGPLDFSALADKVKDAEISIPLVVETPKHSFLAILESDLYAAEGFDVMKISTNQAEAKVVSNTKFEISNSTITTPWRVILVGKTAGDLVINTTPINLATAWKVENCNWVKPGKTLWDWRVHGYTAPDGFVYGINTESYLRFIDFAAKKGIEYFLIDDAWYTKVTKGNMVMSDKLDLKKVISYAKEKNIDIILYYDNRQGEYGDEALFAYYQSLGVKGIKYGFEGAKVPFSKNAIEKSAAHNLLIDFHDAPVPFVGIHRTFPNVITREYCHAQQDSRRAFTPETFIKMALINAITGPLDMNNGNFDLNGINQGLREKGPRVNGSYLSTVTSEVARTLIIFSGLVCIPDAPEAYEAKADLFEFIQKMPVGKWDESKVLNSKMADYITTARRSGNEWFVGSVINQQGGTLDINLDFLTANQVYDITFYEDTKETHCKTNREAYQIRHATAKKGDVIKAVLAPGGGHCMWIRPK